MRTKRTLSLTAFLAVFFTFICLANSVQAMTFGKPGKSEFPWHLDGRMLYSRNPTTHVIIYHGDDVEFDDENQAWVIVWNRFRLPNGNIQYEQIKIDIDEDNELTSSIIAASQFNSRTGEITAVDGDEEDMLFWRWDSRDEPSSNIYYGSTRMNWHSAIDALHKNGLFWQYRKANGYSYPIRVGNTPQNDGANGYSSTVDDVLSGVVAREY